MKKVIVFIAACLLSLSAFAQKDTTIIKSSFIQFDKEISVNKAGKEREEYYAIYKDEVYISDKTSYKRSKLYNRYGCIPIYAIVTDRKTKAVKIIIL